MVQLPVPSIPIDVRIELVEPLLATRPAVKAIFDSFMAQEAGEDEQEMAESLPDEAPGFTRFDHDPETGEVFLWDYQVLGYLKELGNLPAVRDYLGIRNLRAKITQTVLILPRRIYTGIDYGDLETVQRPLRAQTPRGERVTLVKSEAIPAGVHLGWTILLLKQKEITPEHLRVILEMGQFRGLGQWRGGGFGRFRLIRFAVAHASA